VGGGGSSGQLVIEPDWPGVGCSMDGVGAGFMNKIEGVGRGGGGGAGWWGVWGEGE